VTVLVLYQTAKPLGKQQVYHFNVKVFLLKPFSCFSCLLTTPQPAA